MAIYGSEGWDDHTPKEGCLCAKPAVRHGWSVDGNGAKRVELYDHGDGTVHGVASRNGVRFLHPQGAVMTDTDEL